MRPRRIACAVSTELAHRLPKYTEPVPYHESLPVEFSPSSALVVGATLIAGNPVGAYSLRVHLESLTHLAVLEHHLRRAPLGRRSEIALSVSVLDTSLRRVRFLPQTDRIPGFEAWVVRRRQSLVSRARL